MSKNRDYTRYSNSKGPTETSKAVKIEESVESVETVTEDIRINDVETENVIEQEAKVEESEPVIGIVTDCTRLNVREHPYSDSTVLGVITAATELIVIEEESTEDFYKICTSIGLEGYCMKKFITIMP